MAQRDDITRVITDAEGLVAAREFPTALERLRIAAETVPTDHADAAALFLRIRAAAVVVARTNARHAPEAQAVWDIAARRDALMGDHVEGLAETSPLAVAGSDGWSDEEPWFFGAAETISFVAFVASILSFIGGIVVGAEVSKYTTIGSLGFEETHHHAGVVAFWIVSGVFAATAWIGLAVGLNLLTHIARSRRAAR